MAGNAEVLLLSSMEIFSNIESRIERAMQLGEDAIVRDLDREITPILEDILGKTPGDTAELYGQVKFITDLLIRRSDDPATVVRLSAKLASILQETIHDGRLRLDGSAMPVASHRNCGPHRPEEGCGSPEMARVAVISAEYKFLYCNAMMAGDLNVSARRAVGRPVSDFCDMGVFGSAYRVHIDMCLAGALREFKAPPLAGNGSWTDMHVRLTPLRNIERRITGAVLVAQPPEAVLAALGH